MWRRLATFVMIIAVSTTVVASEASASDSPEEVQPYDGATITLQSIGGMGVGTFLAGGSLGLLSQIGDSPQGSSVGGFLGIIGLIGVIQTPAGYVPLTANLAGMARGGDHYLRTYLGGVLGGLVGGLAAIGLAQLVDFGGIENPYARGMVQALPYAAGSTAGSIIGYHTAQSSARAETGAGASSHAPERPALTPSIGSPVGAGDRGVTFGARLQF